MVIINSTSDLQWQHYQEQKTLHIYPKFEQRAHVGALGLGDAASSTIASERQAYFVNALCALTRRRRVTHELQQSHKKVYDKLLSRQSVEARGASDTSASGKRRGRQYQRALHVRDSRGAEPPAF
ncbi:hypothetical protein EVAR_17083_1 [Eumeta japonica]|uniref:Uncharacterized protein n=1 Tax=Eumeta variegata TaxID=151549 RepID=A0A4C1V7N5_EUMVA|nr:hypothetical protein EVAR_17083_1 [Eumeta japonica]